MRKQPLVLVYILLMLSGIASCTSAPPKPVELEKEKALDYAHRGVQWYNKGCYSKALSLFENSLRINQSMDNLSGTAYDYNNMGMIAVNTGNFNQAREFFTMATRIQQGLNDDAGLSLSLSNMATVDLKEGNPVQAERHLEEAYQAAIRRKGELPRASVLNLMGHLYWQKGLLNRANESTLKAVAIYEAKNNKSGLASAYHNLGKIRMAEGNYIEAQTLWEKALDLDQETLNYPGIAADLDWLAQLNLKRKLWAETADYAQRAFNVYFSIGHPEKALSMLEILKKARKAGNLNYPITSFEQKIEQMASPDFDLPCR